MKTQGIQVKVQLPKFMYTPINRASRPAVTRTSIGQAVSHEQLFTTSFRAADNVWKATQMLSSIRHAYVNTSFSKVSHCSLFWSHSHVPEWTSSRYKGAWTKNWSAICLPFLKYSAHAFEYVSCPSEAVFVVLQSSH